MSNTDLQNIYGGNLFKGDSSIIINYYVKRIVYNAKQLLGYMIYGSEYFAK